MIGEKREIVSRPKSKTIIKERNKVNKNKNKNVVRVRPLDGSTISVFTFYRNRVNYPFSAAGLRYKIRLFFVTLSNVLCNVDLYFRNILIITIIRHLQLFDILCIIQLIFI